MSAGVDQRNKGQSVQVANGAKQEVVKDGFDSYLQAPHQPGVYNTAPMSSPNVSEHYVPPSYYPSVSFPYLSQGLSEGPWSNGGDHMSFLGGYGQISNDYNSGMFSGFGYSQPGFGWDFSGGEYSSWGTSPPAQQQGKRTDSRGYGEEYYPETLQPMDAYAPPMNGELERGDGIRTIDQGLKGVSISDGREMEQVSVKENMNPLPSDQMAQNSNSSAVPAKKMTWASIASQPAKPQAPMKPKSIPRAPVLPSKHNMDIGTWDMKNNVSNKQGMGQPRQAWSGGARRGNPGPYASGPNMNRGNDSSGSMSGNASARNSERSGSPPVSAAAQAVLDKLKGANHYNPKEFNVNLKSARFFIIKSYSEDDIHRSIKYSIWCSTEHGNKRLEEAFRERESKGPIYLLFSVNGSGHFCGMAQMMTNLDPHKDSNVWAQSKWKGQFEVKWIYVKDVPNSQLRHIRLENNENKPVTNSRDTQEVPFEKGKQVLKIMHNYRNTTSIFDDFVHYEKRQEEDTRDVVSDRRDAPPSREGRESRKPEPTSPVPPSRENGRRERNGGGGRERSGR